MIHQPGQRRVPVVTERRRGRPSFNGGRRAVPQRDLQRPHMLKISRRPAQPLGPHHVRIESANPVEKFTPPGCARRVSDQFQRVAPHPSAGRPPCHVKKEPASASSSSNSTGHALRRGELPRVAPPRTRTGSARGSRGLQGVRQASQVRQIGRRARASNAATSFTRSSRVQRLQPHASSAGAHSSGTARGKERTLRALGGRRRRSHGRQQRSRLSGTTAGRWPKVG